MPDSTLSARAHADASALAFPERFSAARNRILLHAAIYNRFAENNAVSGALHDALARGVQLEVIILPVWAPFEWMDAACRLVRPENTREDMLHKAEVSRKFFAALAECFPDQVNVYEAALPPAFPLVVIDDTFLSGQYAHSQILAPHGLWIEFSASIEKLLPLVACAGTNQGAPFFQKDNNREQRAPDMLTAESRAAFRYLQEWAAAKGEIALR